MCDVCDEKRAEINAERQKVMGPDGEPVVFLSVYELDRNYGGPEEGGWWYDSGRLVHVEAAPASMGINIPDRIKELRGEYPPDPQDGTPGLGSMAYGGGVYEVRVTNDGLMPLDYWPVVRPHYE